ncbi:unnamed protein product [Caenorhabditis nigoni]
MKRRRRFEEKVVWISGCEKTNIRRARNCSERTKQKEYKLIRIPTDRGSNEHTTSAYYSRSQMRNACDDRTLEKRLQSNKKGIQRTPGYME